MAKAKSKKWMWIIIAIVVVLAAIFGYRFWKARQSAVPKGIAWGNGRVEAKLADVSAKEALRVKEVLVQEGDLVEPGQVLVRLDAVTMNAELASAEAKSAAEEKRPSKANIARKSDQVGEDRGARRTRRGVRRPAAMMETSTAKLAEAEAQLRLRRRKSK
jgi:HlyD family secretion protein